MKIQVMSIPVLNQEIEKAFYTEKLGFVIKHDIPIGDGNRWLTVVSKEDIDGPELLLEPAPNHFEPAKTYQEALFEAGIPCAQFNVENIEHEFKRLTEIGVEFSMKPQTMGPAKIAKLNDTCGNHIQLVELI